MLPAIHQHQFSNFSNSLSSPPVKTAQPMHHIQSKFRANAFRRASTVFILAYLSLFVAAGSTIYIIVEEPEGQLALYGSILGTTLLLWILALIISGTCRCQLCQASTMRSLKCSHHTRAKRLLGSYRLRIAVAILFKGSFRCSYCGEAFNLKPKEERIQVLAAQTQRRPQSRRSSRIPTRRRF